MIELNFVYIFRNTRQEVDSVCGIIANPDWGPDDEPNLVLV